MKARMVLQTVSPTLRQVIVETYDEEDKRWYHEITIKSSAPKFIDLIKQRYNNLEIRGYNVECYV